MSSDKIRSIDELSGELQSLRASGKKVVQCHGVFDLLHIGHIRYLQRARQLGDVLIVTVTPDQHVNKGPHRPAFTEQLRMDALAALECVDYLALNQWPTAVEALRQLQPDIYAKGAEFRYRKTPELKKEEAVATELSIQVEYIDEITSSSSHLINHYLPSFSEEVERYLETVRNRFTADQILDAIGAARRLKVLVVGEAIVEEFYYCTALGQSTRAPIVTTRYEFHERFAGGAVAVANHMAEFCDEVRLLTLLGTDDSEEEWIGQRLHKRVTPCFVYKQDAPTIVKRRYRESYFDIPLFSVHRLDDRALNDMEMGEIVSQLDSVADFDMVAVADYGHSMLQGRVIEQISGAARFLAVTTQSSAANIGFHTVSKYPRADYLSLTRRDLESDCRSRQSDRHPDMLRDVGTRLGTQRSVVTLGKKGCLCYDRDAGIHGAPGLSTHAVDRTGAADAFFAISALCAALDVPREILTFLANVAGAQAVSQVGFSRNLNLESFRRHVATLLK